MRRAPASLLLVLLLGWMALPLVAAQTQGVPACCLRNGKHHCAELAGADGFRAVSSCCSYHGASSLPQTHGAVSGTTVAAFRFNSASNAALPLSASVSRLLPGAVYKRGPPVS